LIDEYDYPIIKHIHDSPTAIQMREIMKNFYIAIKGLDEYLKFVFLTGVSKFSKTSIFSGLNNLQDISMTAGYNDLLGYTKNELPVYFEEYITAAATHNNYSMEQLLDKITTWYDGYKFNKETGATRMYNPFSVLLCLKNKDFANYWFDTGTPTFLINILKTHSYPMQDLEGVLATEEELGQFEVDDIEIKTLMFQTGYLSIKDYNTNTGNYILGYPNKETADSLGMFVMKSMTNVLVKKLKKSVPSNRLL
jgi:hypothetical protein